MILPAAAGDRLLFSIRILLESAIRNCDEFQVTTNDVDKILDWEKTFPQKVEIPFKPGRLLLQDFASVPTIVDLAGMRNAMDQVDVSRSENALQVNLEYLARVVFNSNGILYPNTVLETDSHSSMVNGLGVAGWGVGGIEAEPSMLGQRPQGIEKKTKEEEQISRSALSTFKAKEEEIEKKNLEVR
ncbi:hypothetical protein L2E82_44042 [Cichorium intybus]|uniref:Uncharacterized protein n=1 Tax=Cichorium intybus TaxID=13427 RepID=A0ACB8ZQX5_CICIN|nr:hypothetical protein L2E82_44042 [Cichorium intybus]